MAGRIIPDKPTMGQLTEYLRVGHTNDQAAVHFGVGRRSIVRWRKEAGIDYHSVSNPDCPRGFSVEQKAFLTGSLLGDGNVEKYGRFRMKLKAASRPYLEIAAGILGPFAKPLREERSRKPIRVDGKVVHKHNLDQWCHSVILLSINHPLFIDYRVRWYPDGVKRVPSDLTLTLGALVHWYCQDGSHNPKKRQASISTCGFSWNEAERLATLFDVFGCRPKVWGNSGRPVLGFGSEVYDTFMSLVESRLTELGFAHKGGRRVRACNWTRRV
jgi:hypothetical protein